MPRRITGIIGGIVCILSGLMHGFMGWPALKASFAKTNAPADLVHGLAVPWQFVAMAMVTFGIVAIEAFIRKGRVSEASVRQVLIIGIAYIAFGIAGLAMISFDITFILFLLPGILLTVASS